MWSTDGIGTAQKHLTRVVDEPKSALWQRDLPRGWVRHNTYVPLATTKQHKSTFISDSLAVLSESHRSIGEAIDDNDTGMVRGGERVEARSEHYYSNRCRVISRESRSEAIVFAV